MIIKPTVGRKVWYSPTTFDTHEYGKRGEQHFDATIIFVHGDREVNLDVVSHVGKRFVRLNITLLQDGDAPFPEGGHCMWMPYQVGQAKSAAPV